MKTSKNTYIIWLDEVGRWPLAGPVAVGGVFCLPSFKKSKYLLWYNQITDSKKLSSWQREYLSWELLSCPDTIWVTSFVSAKYIDRHGIVAAIRKASLDVIEQIIKKAIPLLWLGLEQDLKILLDGKTDYGLRKVFAASDKWQAINLETIIRWDSSIREIGAASIIAKVQRDEYMTTLSHKKKYQFYGFDRHKGYGTLVHRIAIAQYGLSDIHRVSFCKNINISNN
jgi:ribonuclease HII